MCVYVCVDELGGGGGERERLARIGYLVYIPMSSCLVYAIRITLLYSTLSLLLYYLRIPNQLRATYDLNTPIKVIYGFYSYTRPLPYPRVFHKQEDQNHIISY